MKRLDVDHHAVKEMISRRSRGNPDYVAGVRAFLAEVKQPDQGTVAHQGYLDTHDMTAHIFEVLGDLRADEIEEREKLSAWREVLKGQRPKVDQTPAEIPKPSDEATRKQTSGVRL